jgi:molybdopterin-guanine dinucleotide biosynthesis protein A
MSCAELGAEAVPQDDDRTLGILGPGLGHGIGHVGDLVVVAPVDAPRGDRESALEATARQCDRVPAALGERVDEGGVEPRAHRHRG